MAEFPPHMPDTGQQVPADPANMLRDVFLANRGRIPAPLVANMIGRHTFTYGNAIHAAMAGLVVDGYIVRDGDDYVWPIQEALNA